MDKGGFIRLLEVQFMATWILMQVSAAITKAIIELNNSHEARVLFKIGHMEGGDSKIALLFSMKKQTNLA